MNDSDKVQRAKDYIESLANGIHPLTGETLTESVFDEPEIIRSLFFVRDILQKHIEHPIKEKREAFTLSSDIDMTSYLQYEPICLTPFLRKFKNSNNGAGPSANKIWDLLVEKGYLREEVDGNGSKTKVPTESGKQNGLIYSPRTRSNGQSYFVVMYNKTGQELILQCIREIYS